jgi:putative transposase
MTNYRRSNIAGACYFFTVNLADRQQSLLAEHIASLRSAFEYARARHPFNIDAIVYPVRPPARDLDATRRR